MVQILLSITSRSRVIEGGHRPKMMSYPKNDVPHCRTLSLIVELIVLTIGILLLCSNVALYSRGALFVHENHLWTGTVLTLLIL